MQTEVLAGADRQASGAACVALRAAAKHSAGLAACVCKCALPALQSQLQAGDPAQQEAAAWTIGYIASHSAELASRVSTLGCPVHAAGEHWPGWSCCASVMLCQSQASCWTVCLDTGHWCS